MNGILQNLPKPDLRHTGYLVLGILIAIGGIIWISRSEIGVEENYKDSAAALVAGVAVFFVSIGLSHSPRQIRIKEIRSVLYDSGVIRQLALLQRNVEASHARLNNIYEVMSGSPDFSRHTMLMEIILEDIDKVFGNLLVVDKHLDFSGAEDSGKRTKENLAALTSIRRDLREAINRGTQAWDAMGHLSSRNHISARNLFAVLSADLLKAGRLIEELLSDYTPVGDEGEQVIQVANYLKACAHRCSEFIAAMNDSGAEIPMMFEVMVDDIVLAGKRLEQLPGVDVTNWDELFSNLGNSPKPVTIGSALGSASILLTKANIHSDISTLEIPLNP